MLRCMSPLGWPGRAADHAALELGECACNLEDELAHGAGRVDVLLIEVHVNAGDLEVFDGAEQVATREHKPGCQARGDSTRREPAPPFGRRRVVAMCRVTAGQKIAAKYGGCLGGWNESSPY